MSSHHPPFPIWKRRTSIPNDLLNLQGSHMVLRVSVYAIISRNAQNTVDGRNPAPVDMENLLLFTGFHLVTSGAFLPSTAWTLPDSDQI